MQGHDIKFDQRNDSLLSSFIQDPSNAPTEFVNNRLLIPIHVDGLQQFLPKEAQGARDHPDLQRILWGKHMGEMANDSTLLSDTGDLRVGGEASRRSTAISGLPTTMRREAGHGPRISDRSDVDGSSRGGGSRGLPSVV